MKLKEECLVVVPRSLEVCVSRSLQFVTKICHKCSHPCTQAMGRNLKKIPARAKNRSCSCGLMLECKIIMGVLLQCEWLLGDRQGSIEDLNQGLDQSRYENQHAGYLTLEPETQSLHEVKTLFD